MRRMRIMHPLSFAVLLFVLLFPSAVCADEIVPAGRSSSGEEIALQDGRVVRLASVKAAMPDAKAFLDTLVSGRTLVLQEEAGDRYGRIVASVFVQGEALSVQEALLREGLVFLYPSVDRDVPDAWGVVERAARENEKGFWATHADVPAEDAAKLYGHYGFITGTVAKAERIRNKVYLTFGNGDARDFTVVIAAKFLRLFKKQGVDPLALQGQKMRVRGWVNRGQGPVVTITNVRQVEMF